MPVRNPNAEPFIKGEPEPFIKNEQRYYGSVSFAKPDPRGL